MKAISQSLFHILIMNQFSLFPNKTKPSAYFCQCIDIESKLTVFFHNKKNKWYCNWGKLVPIKSMVQLWTRACLDHCPYGMLNNGKSNGVMCKSRLIIFNKVLTFIWQMCYCYSGSQTGKDPCKLFKMHAGVLIVPSHFSICFPPSICLSPTPREFCVC